MISVPLLLGALVVAAPSLSGAFAGRGGLPARDVVVTFTAVEAGVRVDWKFADGETGSAPGRLDGARVQWDYRGFRCRAEPDAAGNAFTASCDERLGAEARAPVSFPWTGTRRAPAPAAPAGRPFTLALPEGWQQVAADEESGTWQFAAQGGLLSLSVTVTEADVPVDALYRETLASLRDAFASLKVLEEGPCTLAGTKGRRVVFRARQDEVDIKMSVLVAVVRGRAVVLTFGSTPAEYDAAARGVLQPMVESLALR